MRFYTETMTTGWEQRAVDDPHVKRHAGPHLGSLEMRLPIFIRHIYNGGSRRSRACRGLRSPAALETYRHTVWRWAEGGIRPNHQQYGKYRLECVPDCWDFFDPAVGCEAYR